MQTDWTDEPNKGCGQQAHERIECNIIGRFKLTELLRGRYINLEGSKARRKRIEEHLCKLKIRSLYKRFRAHEGGITQRNNQRLLNKGEIGIWKSWIALLEEEVIDEGQSTYLHILEDDAVVSQEFINSIELLKNINSGPDLIFTDMYVNPSIYKALADTCGERKRRKEIQIIENFYTGCLASVIIPGNRIRRVKSILEKFFENEETLIPLDNAIRRLSSQKILKTATVIPFLTGVTLESIEESTIQNRSGGNISLIKTQIFCSHLRRELSIFDKINSKGLSLLNLALEIMRSDGTLNEKKQLTRSICNFVEENEILVYRLDERLEGEPDNEQ